jgi:predicted SAM-dependent methyltransferase
MLDVLVILQTHSKSSASSAPRYCNAPKIEISKRCLSSLIHSIEYAKNNSGKTKYKLIIVDDHSDVEFIEFVQNKIHSAQFNIELIQLNTYGIMPSILQCYELGKEIGKDLVYFAQDDYLYYDTAIWEMIDAYFQFRNLTGAEVCIFPYDDPFRYSLLNYDYKVILGSKRHWRNAYHTASCFMTNHETIVDNWDLFEAMGKSEYDIYCEDKSINRLFQQMQGFAKREIKHLLFTPIPSLALHMGSDDQKDPYINWQELWNKYKIEENASFKMPEGKIALNLGSGHSRLKDLMFTDDLLNHKEIRVDLDESCNPDIISNIEDLPQIKNESVDLVYSSHSLEHIYFHKVPQCLSEWYRVIKKGGEVRIIVPNLKIPAQLVVEGKILEKMYDSPDGSVSAIDMFYGHRNHVRQNEFMAHKTGFTKESAEQILHELGYNRSSVTEHDTNLLIRIFK